MPKLCLKPQPPNLPSYNELTCAILVKYRGILGNEAAIKLLTYKTDTLYHNSCLKMELKWGG